MRDNLVSAAPPAGMVPGPVAATVSADAETTTPLAFYLLVGAAAVGAGWLLSAGPLAVAAAGTAVALVSAFVLRLGPGHLSRGLVLLATAVLLTTDLSDLGTAGRLWGLGSIAACGVLFVAVPLRRLTVFPLLHLFCLVQGIYLFVSVLVARRPPGLELRFGDQMRVDGFKLSLVFVAVLALAGIAAIRVINVRARQDGFTETTKTGRAVAALVFGTVATIAVTRLPVAARLGALPQLVGLVPLLAGLALIDLWIRGTLAPRFKLLLVAGAVTYALAGVGTGLLYAAAGPFIAALALVVARRRCVPWAVLALVVVSVLVLNSGKGEFRKQYALDAPGGGIARGPEYLVLTARTVAELDPRSISDSAYRFSSSDMLGYLRHHVPERYPYWDKRTYKALPFAVLPRVLVPFKPRLDFSNEFGRQYGILDQTDNVTSANIPLSVEAYVNFGMAGLLGVAAIAGVFLAWVGSITSARRTADSILAALIATHAIGAIESGVTSLGLVIPFLFILRPVARWLVPAVGAPAPAPVTTP